MINKNIKELFNFLQHIFNNNYLGYIREIKIFNQKYLCFHRLFFYDLNSKSDYKNYLIYILTLDLVWRMQLIIIKA